MYHVFRLTKGQDLMVSINNYLQDNNIKAGILLSCVGCVYQLTIRLADGESQMSVSDNFEIVSVTGTLSQLDSHIHISFSGKDGTTIGGHLLVGCLVNTTAEICILELEDFNFERQFDENTGYKELVIIKK